MTIQYKLENVGFRDVTKEKKIDRTSNTLTRLLVVRKRERADNRGKKIRKYIRNINMYQI